MSKPHGVTAQMMKLQEQHLVWGRDYLSWLKKVTQASAATNPVLSDGHEQAVGLGNEAVKG